MIERIICLWIILLSSFSIHAAQGINGDIRAVVYQDEDIQYVEISYYLKTESLQKKYQADSQFQNQILLTVVLKNEDQIVKVDKLLLQSPYSFDQKPIIHLIRWKVQAGKYNLESTLTDPLNPLNEITFINTFKVKTINQNPNLSEIQLYSVCKNSSDKSSILFKNGFYFEPLGYHFLPPQLHILYSYVECYNTTPLTNNKLILHYKLSNIDSNNTKTQLLEWHQKSTNKKRDLVLHQKDISAIPSGKYVLSIYLKTNKGQVLDSVSTYFERYNPFWDKLIALYYEQSEPKRQFEQLSEDSLNFALRSLSPIASSQELHLIQYLLAENRNSEKKLMLYQFWYERSNQEPVEAFNHYMLEVNKVNEIYRSGFGYGFESDRGKIYLRYGVPNEVIQEDNDNGAFPYEIWKYAKINNTGQTNVKFIFYNPDLAGSNFRLLHCNAIGERYNYKWEIELYKNVKDQFKGKNAIEATEMEGHFNRRAREYFDN